MNPRINANRREWKDISEDSRSFADGFVLAVTTRWS